MLVVGAVRSTQDMLAGHALCLDDGWRAGDGDLDHEAGAAGVVGLDADGAALVIHAQSDDNVTDPSGNSGARVACAVIQPGAEVR